jgi:protein transport protein SEC24
VLCFYAIHKILGSLAKYTGGQVYHYASFQTPTHGDKLKLELSRDLTRETAWESVMRIRCGKGSIHSCIYLHFLFVFGSL